MTHNHHDLRELIAWQKAPKTWDGSYKYFAPKGRYDGELTEQMIWAPLGLPPAVSAKKAVMSIFRSPRLLERLCAADLLTPIDDCKDSPYFLAKDICMALAALLRGAKPPRLQKEKLAQPGEAEIGPALTQWRYLKTSKAAEVLGISPRTLSHHAEQDTIPYLRLGKHRLYNIAEIVAHLKKTHTRKRLRPGDIAAVLR